MGSLYQLQVQGTTFFGNSGTPQVLSTEFTPAESFQLGGALAIETPIFASNSSSSDRNVLDAGLFVGSPLDANVQGGELQFATNSAIHREFSDGNFSQSAALDVTSQGYDPQTRTLTIQVDQNFAPTIQLNLFNTRSSFTSTPTQVIGGQIQIQFSEDFQRVAGTVTLLGNGFVQPGQRLYQANFDGFWIQNYTGVAEA